MPDLEPITRDEMLWSGEDVEPITRREMYIRHLYDETQVIPDKPITREEMFILKAGEELHDVTIEQLNVSENGTYSESGKAYSPVIVDVPLPENAYLLKDFENVPSDIVTFNDGASLPMPSLKTTIFPIQSGSGDPSPSNVRPISGWSGANVSVTGKNWCPVDSGEVKAGNLVTFSTSLPSGNYSISFNCTRSGESSDQASMIVYDSNDTAYSAKIVIPNTGSRLNIENLNCNNGISRIYFYSIAGSWGSSQNYTLGITEFQVEQGSTASDYEPYNEATYTIPFVDAQGNPIEVFGGELDVVNGGEQQRTLGSVDLGSLNWSRYDFGGTYAFYVNLPSKKSYYTKGLCEMYPIAPTPTQAKDLPDKSMDISINSTYIYIRDDDYTNVTAFKEAVSGKKLVYELATPTTFYTQPTSIKSNEGENNVWGDCGQISEGSYFSKGEEE